MLELPTTLVEYASMIDWKMLAGRAIWSAGGAFVSLVLAYMWLARDVSYIRGKVDTMADHSAAIADLARSQGALRGEIKKIRRHIGLSHHG